ncbi:hypothetical protein HBA92_22510 [Ochrobactrum sp. MR28]|nr:hypothetical protein [Ochrobactrum sp. MR28]
MSSLDIQNIKAHITGILSGYNIHQIAEDQPLFSSGVGEGREVGKIRRKVESDGDIDLADEDFDINHIDSLQSLESYLMTRKS